MKSWWWTAAGVVWAAGVAWGQVPERLGVPEGVGVNIHFVDDAQPGEMEMLAASGVKWVRADMDWGACERKKGQYEFGRWENLLDQCDRHGIRVLMVMAYANPLYDGGESPRSEEGINAFAKWVGEAVRHFRGRHVMWECYNEPNNVFWRPAPDVQAYIKLALAVGRVVKGIDKNEIYVGPALSGTDGGWMEACYKAGLLEYWDAVTVHPYGNAPPEERDWHWRASKALLERYRPKGKRVPMLSGEWGYSSAGMSEEVQGKMLARMWLVDLTEGVPLSIWYDWRDDGADGGNAENRFGMVRNAYHAGREPVLEPKPAYSEAKRLTTELGGYEFEKRVDVGRKEDWVLVFRKGEKRKVAAWTTGEGHKVRVPGVEGEVRLTDDVVYFDVSGGG